ncbi:MAG TPA: FAD-dependent oxidoreductase [Thermomicrobiales bacterium]|jgi:NADPH-dependent 2,4-dienoyl-CoA reductase/sulfur reductase-like enzyme
MSHFTYLIAGGGMTADAAVRGIREVDPDGSIGLIGSEPDPPYKRPPLSKKLWQGKPFESVWLGTADRGVGLHLGRTVRTLDLRAKQAVDDRGDVYGFDKLLLATGVTPRRLPFGGHRIIYFRTLDDYRRLRSLTEHGRRFAVVGGGFVGSEIAAALATNGKEVAMIFPEEAIGARLFPSDLAGSLTERYRTEGVEVIPGAAVTDVAERGDQLAVTLGTAEGAAGRELVVDGIVAGIGTRPNVELAEAAGLATADGIVVDPYLRTSHPDVHAAGDVARFCQPALGELVRVEHEDNAKRMGRAAGRAMAGDPAPYDHLPYFYSDLFDLGYEAVGEVDARLDTVADWAEPYRRGVVYFVRDARVRGVLLWNVWDRTDDARELVGSAQRFRAPELIGRIAIE